MSLGSSVQAWQAGGGAWRSAAVRVGALLLVVAVYLVLVRPARVVVTGGLAMPMFEAVSTPRAEAFDLIRSRPVHIEATPRSGSGATAAWAAPAGIPFLLPGLLLALSFPTRPYWLYMLAFHVALGVVLSLEFAAGLAWADGWFLAHTFTRTYVSELGSFAVPALLVAARWSDRVA